MRTERIRLLPALVVALLFVGFGSVILGSALDTPPAGIDGTTTDVIGESIFDDFLASFELVAVLLVASLVAGVYLAKPEQSRREAVREAVRSKPRTDTDKDSGGNDGTE